MTYADFCKQNHVTIWAAQRVNNLPRWRLVLRHHDGRHTQITLTVRAQERPAAPAVLKAMVHECKQYEAAPTVQEWQQIHGDTEQYKRAGNQQLKLIRFLGLELYRLALECEEDIQP
jgi:hypothetical protein